MRCICLVVAGYILFFCGTTLGCEDLGLSSVFEYRGIVADDGRRRNTCVRYFPT